LDQPLIHKNVMDRRSFFKTISNKAARSAVRAADSHVSKQAGHWIRPPYALEELEFLLACTRCNDCVEACPQNVIFKLPARLGTQVTETPALDLLNKGCQLCKDWPCVNACKSGALVFPELADEEIPPLPKIARAEINTRTCLPYSGPECGACEALCPVPGALKWDLSKPFIDTELCTGCGLCREACIVDPKAVEIHSIHHQG
jgi:ferredoxin-type protein NapG